MGLDSNIICYSNTVGCRNVPYLIKVPTLELCHQDAAKVGCTNNFY